MLKSLIGRKTDKIIKNGWTTNASKDRVIIYKMNDECQKTKPYVNPLELRRKQTPPRNKELNVLCRMTNDETELS